MITTINIQAGQTSEVNFVPPGSRITSSGNGSIEWMPGTLTDAKNAPDWTTWAKSNRSGYMDTVRPMTIRAIATGAMTVTIEEGKNDKYGEDSYWGEDTPNLSTDANGITSLIGPNGKSVVSLKRAGNVGTRMLAGRTGAFDNAIAKTFRAIIEVAASGFDAVRPIFCNGNTGGTYTVAGCNVRAIASLTDALPTPTAATLPSGGVVPAAPVATRPNYLVGDWISLSSIPRTDGGIGALLCIDAYVSTAASITIMGNGGNDIFSGWVSRANRKWLMRHNDGDCVTTPANFVSTVNQNQSPIVGVQYLARGRVVTVMGVGDSVTDGRGTIISEGFGVPACEQASDVDGVVFEWSNRGFASASATAYAYDLDALINVGIVPDIAVFPNGSPNDNATPITAANIYLSRQQLARLLLSCRANQITPVIWTEIPTNPAKKDYNASDSLRRDMNTATKLYGGYDVLDFDAALSGVTDVDGQVNMLAGSTTDNIHPNDTGNALLTTLLLAYLRRIVS